MRIDVLTLFPEMFERRIRSEHLGKAQGERHRIVCNAVNFRDFSNNKHNTVDDTPYGGGGGMVLKAGTDLRAACCERQSTGRGRDKARADYSDVPARRDLHAAKAAGVVRANRTWFLFAAITKAIDETDPGVSGHGELSIGDYVLTGGEIPAMVVIDSVVAAASGSARQRAVGGDRFVRRRTARISALYASRRIPRMESSGCAFVRTPCRRSAKWRRQQSLDRTLAAPSGALLERADCQGERNGFKMETELRTR